MNHPIHIAKTDSSRRTSTVIWPNDNKAIGTCFHALIADLFPVLSMLVHGIGFPLLLLGAWLVLLQPSAGQSGTWTETGSLIAARIGHTATLLPNGKFLAAGYADFPSSAELYDPASGTWTATGSMVTGRYLHTATLLPNGQVLVAGGYNGAALASAELYDPASGLWTTTGSMATARRQHTATLLPNGQVLVAGGFAALDSAELYDPATGRWTTTGSMTTGHGVHTATLLPTNGQVLVAGGNSHGRILASAELYDPATGLWTETGSMADARGDHSATLVPNGQVLVAGGAVGVTFLASAELYDPTTGLWTATGSMAEKRSGHTATLLSDGQVLVAGGAGGVLEFLRSAELYDSAIGSPITLSGAGRKVGGINTVRLTWSGATSTDIDVYRDGSLIVTTLNDGSYIDSTGHTGRARYTYQVCEAGTQACSNEVTVTFAH